MSKRYFIHVAGATVLTTALFVVPLASAQAGAQTQPPAPRPAEGPATKTGSASDSDFVTQASKAGAKEVELGRLAAKQALNADVKAFASRMVTDHSKASDELTALAKKHGVALPPAATLDTEKKAAADKLVTLQGAAFDRAYMEQMVTAHRAAVELFERESKEGTNAELKAFAAKTLPTVRDHLKQATALQAKVGETGVRP
jgi:putative membrane protein